MAVRVRKLARELDRSTEDVLQLLRDIGIERFKTEDDMLPDPVVDQVRKAARVRPPRALITPSPVDRLSTPDPAAMRETLVPASRRDTGLPPPRRGEGTGGVPARAGPTGVPTLDGDLMAMLVPGVVRVGERRTKVTAAPSSAPTAPPRAAVRTVPPEDLQILAEQPRPRDERREALEAANAELQRLRAERDAEARALAMATAAVQEQERAMAELRSELIQVAARVVELESKPPPEPAGVTFLSMLEERGLRGVDEAERAVTALSAAHLLGKVLGTLVVADPASLRRLLSERLVLFGGPVPDGLPYPAVTVSADRADIPGAEALHRVLGRIGELSLLNGCRRVLVVGVAPRWHTLVRDGVDRRVELVFRASVGEEPGRIDLVVAWAAQDSPPVEGRRRFDLRASSLGEFLERWANALAG